MDDNRSLDSNSGQRGTNVHQIAWERLTADLTQPKHGRFKIYGGEGAEACGIEDEAMLHSAVAMIKENISGNEALFGYSIFVDMEEQNKQEVQEEAKLCIFAEKTEILARIFLYT